MKYYLHDTNSLTDEKVTLLFIEFGYEAVGLFYVILEKLALQEKPVSEKVLKTQLKIGKRLTKQLNYMYEIGILSIKNGDVFNENILKFSQKYQIKKEKTRIRVSEWRESQGDKKNVTSYKRVRNTPKVKESKVKENKEIKKPKNHKIDFSGFPKELIELSKRVIKLFPESVINDLTAKQKFEWIDTLRKLNEIDKLSLIEIEKIIKFARNSDFWSKNFLSVLKLRKKNKENIKYYIVFKEEMKSEQKKNIGRITEDSVCQNTELYPDRMKWGHRK